MRAGDIVMLENTRFDPRETSKNKKERISLAQDILSLVPACESIFVLDGFPISHRDNTASITEIAELVPGVKGHWQEIEEKLHNDFLKVLESRNRGFSLSTGGGASIAYFAHRGKTVATKYLKGWKT